MHISSYARRAAGVAVLALSLGVSLPALAQNATFSLGLWGDMPYAKNGDTPKIPALIADMNASDIAFSMFDGDTKDGSSKCTDASYTEALARFNALEKPAVYVPGDNEWTDCHRTNNGSYDNLERLKHLREVMFPTADGTLGKTSMTVERQGKPGEAYVENVRFLHGGVMFVGLNVPGSNNNYVVDEKSCKHKSERPQSQCDADNKEYLKRDAANISWMEGAFAKAKAANAAGVMIVIQADPGFDVPETEDVDESRTPNHSGYFKFLDALIAQTQDFGGQVVLVHGDTHYFKIDKPLIDATHMIPNFTRVETFGSPNIHWLKVDVDASTPDVFTFHPMIIDANK